VHQLSGLKMSYKYGEGEIGVFMPAINTEKAKQAAEILKARAGIQCNIIVAIDNERVGFIAAVINHLFKESN
jgi:GGDEF domain-containing protein